MAIELHHLHPSHDDELTRLKARIAELEKENAELKEKRRWRKFPDEKPKWGIDVWIIDKDGYFHKVRFSHDMKWISWGKMNTCESDCVAYWMPLQSAPKEE